MEQKYGRERLDDLEASAGPKKWTRDELLELKEYYTTKIKEMQAGHYPSEQGSVVDLFAKVDSNS